MQTYTHSTLPNLCLLCRRNQGGDRQEQWTPPGTELCRKCPRKRGRTVLCAGPGAAEMSLGRCPLLICPTHRCERGPSAAVSHCHCHTVTAPSTSQIQGRNARRMPRRDSTAVPWARVSGFPAFPLQPDPHVSRKLLDCHCRAAATEIRLGISRRSNFFSFF